MQQQNMAMASSCNKCGELFDVAYDMESSEYTETSLDFNNKNKALCWGCRK